MEQRPDRTPRITALDQVAATITAAIAQAKRAEAEGQQNFSLIACETGQGDVAVLSAGMHRISATEMITFCAPVDVGHAARLAEHVFELMAGMRVGFRMPFRFEGERYALVPQVLMPQILDGFLNDVVVPLAMAPPVFIEIVPLGAFGTPRAASLASRVARMARAFEPPEADAIELFEMLRSAHEAVAAAEVVHVEAPPVLRSVSVPPED